MNNYSCLQYKKNVYSQNGEDGIIEYIFKTLGIQNGNFIEFGAWDGIHLSNCYKLLNEGWSGIYIEADKNKYNDLVKNFGDKQKITLINKMVGYEDDDNLDLIIEHSNHENKDFDFISIDVDGLDYNIFKATNTYLPKVICIEVNAGHSPEFDQELSNDIAVNNIGQSLQIVCNLAATKGYFPLCYTGNLFLVKNEYKHLFLQDIKPIKDLYIDFLSYLDNDGVKHLYNTFVVTKYFNGLWFHNQVLEDFCNTRILHN